MINFFSSLFDKFNKKRKKIKTYSIEDKKHIYSYITNGDIDKIKEFFRSSNETDFHNLKYTNVIFSIKNHNTNINF